MGVEDKDFLEVRERKQLQTLFGTAGMKLEDNDFEQVYSRAEELSFQIVGGRSGAVGIEVFRRAYNEYDDARYVGKFPSWWFDDEDASTDVITIPLIKKKTQLGAEQSKLDLSMPPPNKKPRVLNQDSQKALPLQQLSSDSQRYNRAITVLKQFFNHASLSNIPIQAELNLDEGNLQQLHATKYKVTWGSVGRRGLLLVLSDGIFFLENDDNNIKVSFLTCPLYVPNPQKPATCQHRTLLDVVLVTDKEHGISVPRFLVSDILVHMGYVLMNKPWNVRFKYVIDGVILARKKSTKIWNYSKERIRLRAKEFFDLKEVDFVCNQVVKAQFHVTDGLRFVPQEGTYLYNVGSDDNDVLVCKSCDEVIMGKMLKYITEL